MKRGVSPYNPANALSLLRIVLVPVFVILLKEGKQGAASAVFVAASLTDFVDGWAARRFGWQTRLGEFIDPLGDKMLSLAALVMLTLQHRIPFWISVTAVARELMVVSGYVLIAVVSQRTALKVSFVGKAATLFEMLFLSLLLASPVIRQFHEPRELEGLLVLGLAASVILSFVSGLDYAARGIHDFEKNRRG